MIRLAKDCSMRPLLKSSRLSASRVSVRKESISFRKCRSCSRIRFSTFSVILVSQKASRVTKIQLFSALEDLYFRNASSRSPFAIVTNRCAVLRSRRAFLSASFRRLLSAFSSLIRSSSIAIRKVWSFMAGPANRLCCRLRSLYSRCRSACDFACPVGGRPRRRGSVTSVMV